MSTLEALIDQASRYAEAMFDPDDVITPHFVAEAADGSITIAAVAADGTDLDRLRQSLGVKFLMEGYRRWVFLAEAWMVVADLREAPPVPVDHPERMEVIQFDAFEPAARRRVRARRQIVRLAASDVRLMPLVISGSRSSDVPAATRPGR